MVMVVVVKDVVDMEVALVDIDIVVVLVLLARDIDV